MVVIDLKSQIDFGQKTLIDSLKGPANVHRKDHLLATVRLLTKTPIRQMRSQIPRKPSDKNFFMFRPIPMYGVCPDNISSESSRYRNLSSRSSAETLPLRYKGKCFPNHTGQSKRKSGLEDICGLRTNPNKQSPNALCQRGFRYSTESRSLCSGFNNHRFVSFIVSMGKISQAQSRSKSSHTYGLKRLYSHVYPHYSRICTRCKYPRRTDFRAGRYLHHGSRLPRLRSFLYVHSKPFNVYYKGQKQFRLPPSLLSQGRQKHRPTMRPDNKAQWLLRITGLPCGSPANQLFRHRYKQKIRIFNKQLYSASFDNCVTLQMPLADRNLFQMDQAIPANQNIFRNYRKRSEDSNLDCYQRLCSGRNCQERTRNRTEFERNPANSQHCTFRESPYYTSTYEKCLAKQRCSVS
jgi:hypothetical protein